MKSATIVIAVACVLPLGAAAEDFPMPRMLKSMEKGQWRIEMLENSHAKPGQKMPVMTLCTDNLLKQAQEPQAATSERRCTDRLLKDASDQAVLETKCPERTAVTTITRESSKSVLAEINSTGERPMHAKVRYTYAGACRAGQATMTLDKNSEQCKKIRASIANLDPVKSCAGAGANREQCENMMRQQVAQATAMCN